MTIENLTTIPALEALLQGSQPVIFNVLGGKTERYQFIQKQLVKFRWTPSTGNGFSKKYQTKDIMLLAKMDARHETPCGHAVKKLC